MTKLLQALLAAQRKYPTIHKDATNPFHKSKYAPLDSVLAAVVPTLNAEGVILTQSVTTPDRNEAGQVTAVTIVTSLLHAESGERLDSPLVMPVAKSDPQGMGGAITYGRRYGILNACGLTGEDDDDGNAASRSPKVSKAKADRATNLAVWPFGEHKGKLLTALTQEQLVSGLEWMKGKNDEKKFGLLIASVENELEDRRDRPEALRDGPDGLPFK